jgi:hypothetical protein
MDYENLNARVTKLEAKSAVAFPVIITEPNITLAKGADI